MSCNDFDITIDNIIRVGQKEEETINVIPTKENKVIYPTPNKTIGKVEIQPIPSEYVVPSGEITITEQGTFNVKDYEKAIVTAPFDSKFAQLINGTLVEVTEEDLAGASKVNDYAFYKQIYLHKVNLLNTITTIGSYAFYGNSSLQEIYGENVSTVGNAAFQGCSTLQRFVGSNITTIGDNAFRTILRDVDLNVRNVTSLGTNAFDSAKIVKFKFDKLNQAYKTYQFASNTSLRFMSFGSQTYSGVPTNYIGKQVTYRFDKIPTFNESNVYASAITVVINTPYLISLTSAPSNFTANKYFPLSLVEEYKVATNWATYASTIYPSVANEQERLALDTTLYTKCYQNDTDQEFWFENGSWVLKYTEGVAE